MEGDTQQLNISLIFIILYIHIQLQENFTLELYDKLLNYDLIMLQMPLLLAESRSSLSVLKSSKRQLTNNHPITEATHDSASSSEGVHSDSSQSVGKRRRSTAR